MRGAMWMTVASTLLFALTAHGAVVESATGSNVNDLINRASDILTATPAPSPTSSSNAPPNTESTAAPTVYTPVTTMPSVTIAEDVSVFAELYSTAPPVIARNLRDNTQNTEAVVQSAKPPSATSDITQGYPSPITVQAPAPETSTSGRRLAEDSPLTVMFCDPAGNAIWKWDYYASKTTTPPPKNTTVTTTTTKVATANGVCDARTTVKVSAYQAGCSKQNHPEGCENVFYKGCGGLTVHPESKRVVVARTGGRSLGVLDYKSKKDTCQGRTVDALTTFKGRKFNSPSDAEFAKNGDLYFTDSPFGLATKQSDLDGDTLDVNPKREIPFNGVYVLKNNSKTVDLVDCTMDRPNKIAFSTKNSKMYITNSRKHNSYVKEFPIAENGTVGTPSIFFNFSAHPELKTDDGYANGIKVDEDGNVFVVAYRGVYVFSSKAELLVAIRSNQELSGVSLGADRIFYSGAFGVASQAGVNFSTVREAVTDC